MKLKISSILFLSILLFFFFKGIFYTFYIPPWEAPDEPGHVNYVFYLYHNKKLPDTSIAPGLMKSIVSSWNYQRKYLIPSAQQKVAIKPRELFSRSAYDKEPSANNITQYPPLHYLYLLPFLLVSLHFSSYVSLIFLRFGSLLLGGASLFVVFKITELLFPKIKYLPHLVMLLMALDPMFGFIHSVVNNDAMVILFFLSFLYLVLRFILFSKTTNIKYIILIGFFVGLSTFVKPQLLILPVIYLITLYVHFNKRIDWEKYTYIFMSTIFVPILWYGYKYLQQGSSSLTYSFVSKSTHSFSMLLYPWVFLKTKEPSGIFMTFWGFFGWLDVSMPKIIYGLFALLIAVAIGGWLKKRKKNYFSKEKKEVITFFSITSISYTAFIFLYDIFFFAKGGNFGIQGRYFLPLLPILLLFIIQGILFFNTKLKIVFFSSCIFIFILSQVLMYISISSAYYHGYYLISPLTKVYK